MSELTRDGMVESVSRDQSLRRERGQEKNIFLVQLTTTRIGNHIRLIHTLLKGAFCIAHAHLIPIVGMGKERRTLIGHSP